MTTSPTFLTSLYDEMIPTWMRGTVLEDVWRETYIQTGSSILALESVRRDTRYDDFFPGNRRDDGTLRLTEYEYLSLEEGYAGVLASIGLNPELFASRFPELIAGDVDISEFTRRVESARAQIIDQAPALAAYYASEYGLELSQEAIVASFIDPDVGEGILNRRIAITQVGAAAWERGFAIDEGLVRAIADRGVTLPSARDFFAQADELLPVLDVLAKRHADPDDTFDLNEFAGAVIMENPEERARFRRLLNQERSTFSQPSFGSVRSSDAGSLTGLAER